MPPKSFALILAALVCCGAGCAPHPGHAKHSGVASLPSGADPGRGRTIFAAQCAACHGAAGAAGPVGPSLRNERARKPLADVEAIVRDPSPPMPKLFPAQLSARDVQDVSAYVETL